MAEDKKTLLKTVGLWAGRAAIVSVIAIAFQFLYSLYQNRVILNVSFQPGKLVYYCGDRQSEKNCLNEEGYEFLKAIGAEVIFNFSENNEFIKSEINKELIGNHKKKFEDSISKYKIKIPFIIIISNNGNRDTTITKASFDIYGYKEQVYSIETNNLLKKVKANSTEKIELSGITFGGDMRIPGEVFVNSFYGIAKKFGKEVLGVKIVDEFDLNYVNYSKSLFVKMMNDEIVKGDIIIKLVVEDQFGNRKTQELNLNSLPMNLY
jgi:hypothetical protein